MAKRYFLVLARGNRAPENDSSDFDFIEQHVDNGDGAGSKAARTQAYELTKAGERGFVAELTRVYRPNIKVTTKKLADMPRLSA